VGYRLYSSLTYNRCSPLASPRVLLSSHRARGIAGSPVNGARVSTSRPGASKGLSPERSEARRAKGYRDSSSHSGHGRGVPFFGSCKLLYSTLFQELTMPDELPYLLISACYLKRALPAGDPPLSTSDPAGPTSDSTLGRGQVPTSGRCSAIHRVRCQPVPAPGGGSTSGPRPGRAELRPVGHGFGSGAADRNPVVHANHMYHIVGYDARKKCWASVAYRVFEVSWRAT
jgi:hypothetical protein